MVLERALVLFGSNAEHDAGGFASWFADLCVSQAASEFADEVREHDIEIDERGVTLLIDKKDIVYLQGMEINYAKKGLNEGFEFQNPNAKAECGCGESFTV